MQSPGEGEEDVGGLRDVLVIDVHHAQKGLEGLGIRRLAELLDGRLVNGQ
jgi:hypothetical protein